jgi:16S rRNA (cytidine1402-2'-O)-methyltransferase
MSGTLYLVSTPIGNLEDITVRAIRILSEVDLIACEDTRQTRVLLNHYNIETRLTSYHEHNETERAGELGELLKEGKKIACVTDAGTPGISDPGYRLVRMAIDSGARIVPVPGATAFVSALICSGLPTDQFYFGGFLPSKPVQRRARLQEVKSFDCTLIFYESPHRIGESLRDAQAILGEREAVVAREITKVYEEFARGKLSDLINRFSSEERQRGEMVILIDRTTISEPATEASILRRVTELENEGLDPRSALKKAARELGLSRDEAYRRLMEERSRDS